ncbi:hypothetical protein KDL29_09380 [bacterium]|nr:hypothetical protein [bacterium]MCB1220755.1 hypothetical protein [bacterium]UNM09404.1 MAG: hypothetical protein H7A35_04945 [Planctomycetales bacterium]
MKKISITIATIALFALCSCSGQGSTDMLGESNTEYGNPSLGQDASVDFRDTSGFVHFDDETVD